MEVTVRNVDPSGVSLLDSFQHQTVAPRPTPAPTADPPEPSGGSPRLAGIDRLDAGFDRLGVACQSLATALAEQAEHETDTDVADADSAGQRLIFDYS